MQGTCEAATAVSKGTSAPGNLSPEPCGGDCGIISNLNTIQEFLLQYIHRNLIDTEMRSQLLEHLFEDYPYLNPEHTPQDIHESIPLSDHEILNTKRAPKHIDMRV